MLVLSFYTSSQDLFVDLAKSNRLQHDQAFLLKGISFSHKSRLRHIGKAIWEAGMALFLWLHLPPVTFPILKICILPKVC